MRTRDALEWVVALAIMVPISIAVFLFIFGGMIATLLGFGPPVD